MLKSIAKKSTYIDRWYRSYTDNCAYRTHKRDKKRAGRTFRYTAKKIDENA